jgi:hypothetical protein
MTHDAPSTSALAEVERRLMAAVAEREQAPLAQPSENGPSVR